MPLLAWLFPSHTTTTPAADSLVAALLHEASKQIMAPLVLAVVSPSCSYGYAIRKELSRRGFFVDDSRLYPVLLHLEGSGLLAGTWTSTEGPATEPRRRRQYHLTPLGEEVRDRLACAFFGPLYQLITDTGAAAPPGSEADFLRHYRDYPADAFDVHCLLTHLRELPAGSRLTVHDLLAAVYPGAVSHADLLPAIWHLIAAGQLSYQAATSAEWEDAIVYIPGPGPLMAPTP